MCGWGSSFGGAIGNKVHARRVVDVDIGANTSAEGGGENEGVDDQTVRVVDIVDTFRLQEQPPFDKKLFVAYIKKYIKLLTPKLEGDKQEECKKKMQRVGRDDANEGIKKVCVEVQRADRARLPPAGEAKVLSCKPCSDTM